MSKNFVHLHSHSHYSLLDASNQIEATVKRVKELGMPAIALTDHGNMSGAVELWRECKKENIKPLVGCELYVSVGDHTIKQKIQGQKHYHHLIVIAMNKTGYKNLCKIVSEGYLEGFYYKPRVSLAFLAKHSEGLFCSTACLASATAQVLLNIEDQKEAIKKAQEVVDNLHSIFGDNLRLELQDHGIPEQRLVNLRMISLHLKTNIPLVFTNDCHFLTEDDFQPHKCFKCIPGGQDVNNVAHVYRPDHRIKSPEEMYKIIDSYDDFPHVQKLMRDAMDETNNVADMCDFSFETGVYHFPDLPITNEEDKNKSVSEIFRKKCIEGFEKKSIDFDPNKSSEYFQRFVYEMDLISKMGFESYFLIVADLIEYAKDNNIPVGPGRGSAAGSLVSYCLGITDLDPLKHQLIFERFLNPARVSMPDIDIDFGKRDRSKMLDYCIEKYGRDNVSQIITFGALKPRAVIKDMCRVHQWSIPETIEFSNTIPDTPGNPYTLDRAYNEIPDVKNIVEKDDRHRNIWKMAKALENVKRHSSIHAAGVVITPEPITNYAPLFKPTKSEDVAAAYDMEALEEIGLVKMDFLGLKTLDVIKDICEETGARVDRVSLDDPKVYKLFARGDTKGIFQFESPGMRGALKGLGPTEFNDIVSMNALYRPGPIDSGMLASFIKRKNNREKIDTLHSDVEEVLRPTYGLMIFQEQVMEVMRIIGGFSLAEADIARKAIGKKKKELMEKEVNKFIDGAIKRGYDKNFVESLAEKIKAHGRYSFNRSHSAAYSLIAYQTAYLKTYYPLEFMRALLSAEAEDNKPDKVQEYLGDAKQMKIKILPPDINYSDLYFTIENNSNQKCIRYGIGSIKNVGSEIAESIIEERNNNGQFRSLPDLLNRMPKINKRCLEGLIFAGATGSLPGHAAEHFANMDQLLKRSRKQAKTKQKSLLSYLDNHHAIEDQNMISATPWTADEISTHEKEVLGVWLQYHPLDDYTDKIQDDISTIKSSSMKFNLVAVINDVLEKTSRAGKKYIILKLGDLTGETDALIFDTSKIDKTILKEGNVVFITGNSKQKNDKTSVYVNTIKQMKVEDTNE